MARAHEKSTLQLESLRPLPLKELVVRRLRTLIDDGTLRPGDRLPSERELAEQLRVSRGTVREAVQFLTALGLLEIRHGSGTFVRQPLADPQELRNEWRDWIARHTDTIHDLLEVRMGLESFAAELAVERASDVALEHMAAAIGQMENAVEGEDLTALVQSDVCFHGALCEATRNRALAELAHEIGNRLLQERAATWGLPGRAALSLIQHREIYQAVRGGDANSAHRFVLAHLRSVLEDVEGLLANRPSSEREHEVEASRGTEQR